ncbi:MAG: hypothetical protein ABIW79_07060, partial [Gemmatimonas sp.]
MRFPGFLRGTSAALVVLSAALVPALACARAAFAPALAGAQSKTNQYGNPERMVAAPTKAAIDVRDLQSRLYVFADDSMLGRQIGRVGNKKGTDYIAAEVQRLGLLPAGDNGSYFQVLPYHVRKFTSHSRMTVNGNPLEWNAEWVAVPGTRQPRAVTTAEAIFGGTAGDTSTQISAAQAAGKFVVLRHNPNATTVTGGRGGAGFGGQATNRFPDAVAVATIDLDALTPAQRIALNEPTGAGSALPPRTGGGGGRGGAGGANAPVDSIALLKSQLAALTPQAVIRLTTAAANRLFPQGNVDALTAGAKGGNVTASLEFV